MAIITAGWVADAAPTKIIFYIVSTFYVGMHTRTLRVQALVTRSVKALRSQGHCGKMGCLKLTVGGSCTGRWSVGTIKLVIGGDLTIEAGMVG